MGKQVKTPRFYVDIPTFLHATGDLQWGHGSNNPTYDGGTNHGGAELLYLNPANPFLRNAPHQSDGSFDSYIFKIGMNYENDNADSARPKVAWKPNYFALVNHNIAGTSTGTPYIRGRFMDPDMDDTDGDGRYREINSTNFLRSGYSPQEVINFNISSERFDPNYNGTSIMTIANTIPKFYTTFELFYGNMEGDIGGPYAPAFPHQLGSFSVGRYWDAPNSPDLNLTMSRRFDGIKRQKTIGGKTLANIYYDGPTEWNMHRYLGDGTFRDYNWGHHSFIADWDAYYGESQGKIWGYKYGAFDLDPGPRVHGRWNNTNSTHIDDRVKPGLGRKGLRSWKLSFSYIAESDMWIDNEVSNRLINDGDPDTSVSSSILEDSSFNFVWNCTLGGTLPFIFQPDNSTTGTNPDRFAICTFRENTLNVKQVAHNTYSLSITIDEVA